MFDDAVGEEERTRMFERMEEIPPERYARWCAWATDGHCQRASDHPRRTSASGGDGLSPRGVGRGWCACRGVAVTRSPGGAARSVHGPDSETREWAWAASSLL